jgi:hypothetical protein
VVRGWRPVGLRAEALNEGAESNGLGLRSSSQGMLDKTDFRDCVHSVE